MNPAERFLGRFDRFQQAHKGPAFVVAVVKKFGDDRGGTLAALVTYYGLLSLFPLLLVLVTVLGIVLQGNPGLRHDLVNSALADFPVIGNQLRNNVHALRGSGLALAIGLLGVVWGGLGVAHAAQHAMAEVWNVPDRDRPGFVARVSRALLFLGVLAVAVAATTFVASAVTLVSAPVVVEVLTIVATIAINVVSYTLAFRILSPASVSWHQLWPGAVVGGVLWTGLQSLGGWLVARRAAPHERAVRLLRDRPRIDRVPLHRLADHGVRRGGQRRGRPPPVAAPPRRAAAD